MNIAQVLNNIYTGQWQINGLVCPNNVYFYKLQWGEEPQESVLIRMS
jgi:hypothetical protein